MIVHFCTAASSFHLIFFLFSFPENLIRSSSDANLLHLYFFASVSVVSFSVGSLSRVCLSVEQGNFCFFFGGRFITMSSAVHDRGPRRSYFSVLNHNK
jgi:hypothetical protein